MLWLHRFSKLAVQVVLADETLMPSLSWLDDRAHLAGIYTTERLHCGRVQRLKATAIIGTLANKCGEDAFVSILRNLLQRAQSARNSSGGGAGVVGATTTPDALPAYVIGTAAFLRQVSTVGGFRKEINSFAERWIYGSGCPMIQGAVHRNADLPFDGFIHDATLSILVKARLHTHKVPWQ